MKLWALLLCGIALPSLAAGACERQIRTMQRATGPGVAKAYGAVAACSQAQGTSQFAAALKRTTDTASYAALATAAIRNGVVEPVHGMLEVIGDYSVREDVVESIGAGCDDPAVLAFVRGLHGQLKDRAFVSWAPAVAACSSPDVAVDLEAQAQTPPAVKFDNKYAKVVELYGQRAGAGALPLLQDAAIAAAANNGPYSAVLDAMVKSVTPDGLNAKPEGADAQALSDALLGVAAGVTDEQAGRVADALIPLGAEDAAATLLPRLHPGKQQGDGSFLYGVAAVESCDGAAVVHWAVVQDLGGRWSVLEDVDGRARSFKRKLKACSDDWVVSASPQPAANGGAVEDWAQTVADATGVDDVKLKSEKRIELGRR